jgi:MFS family permease
LRELLQRNRNFKLISGALALSLFGDWVGLLAIFSLLGGGNPATEFSLLLVLKQLPIILFSSLGGKLADTFSRRKLMIISDVARAVLVATLIINRSHSWIYTVVFLQSTFSAFFEPARGALVPRLVPLESLGKANGVGAFIWSSMLILGSSIGGVILEIFGVIGCLIIDSLSYIFSGYLIAKIRDKEFYAIPEKKHQDAVRIRSPRLLTVISIKGVYGFGAAMYLILAVLGAEKFAMGASGTLGISILYSCRGLGALMGPLLSLRIFGDKNHKAMILGGLFLMGFGYFGISVFDSLVIVGLATVLAHMGGSTLWVYSTTLLQHESSDEIRGRATGVELSGFFFSSTISQIVFGALMGGMIIAPETAAFSCALIWWASALGYVWLFRRYLR